MYPTWKPKDLKAITQLWQKTLEPYSYEEVELSLLEFFRSDVKGFAPLPGQLIRPIVEKRMSDQTVDEGKAWAMVREAIGNSGYDSVREFKKLPPVIQMAVGDPYVLFTWSQTDTEQMTVIQSQFLRSYRSAKEQAITQNATNGIIPEGVLALETDYDEEKLIEEIKTPMSDAEQKEILEWWEQQKEAQ